MVRWRPEVEMGLCRIVAENPVNSVEYFKEKLSILSFCFPSCELEGLLIANSIQSC